MTNGRRKGNAGEREVCKLFSMWWGGKFERRSMGMAGSDIITPKNFPWSLEVKHVKTMRVRHFFKPTAELIKFWKQAFDQGGKEDKDPLLVMKVEGTWFTAQLVHTTTTLNEDYFLGTIAGARILFQTIDGFMLDRELWRDDFAAKKAA